MEGKLEQLVTAVLNCGLQLHRDIGPGLLESVYEQVFSDRLEALGLNIDRQQPVNIVIDGKTHPEAFRFDILVNGLLLIEVKSIERMGPVRRLPIYD